MAEQLQGPGQAGKPHEWRHDWHPYEDYLSVHAEHMSALAKEGVVLRDGLTFTETRDHKELVAVQIRGYIECAGNLLVFVDKWLDVRRGKQRRYEVRGTSYSYHAWVRGSGATLLRYDSAHGLDQLHRHRLIADGSEIVEPIHLGMLPTLTGFIREALDSATQLDRT
jgi:hypothetical protein